MCAVDICGVSYKAVLKVFSRSLIKSISFGLIGRQRELIKRKRTSADTRRGAKGRTTFSASRLTG